MHVYLTSPARLRNAAALVGFQKSPCQQEEHELVILMAKPVVERVRYNI